MNEQIHEALMKHVERAVRPLRAGRKRKLQMREELLGHLTAIFRDELDQRHDEAAALAAAQERFGDPAELAAELAASLSWRDRWEWRNEGWIVALDRTLSWRQDERFSRFAFRTAAWLAGANVIFCLFMIAFAWLGGREHFDPTFASFNLNTALLFSYMAVSECALVWAIQTTWRTAFATAGRRRHALTALQLAGWTACFTLLAAGFWFGLTGSASEMLERLPRIAIFAAATLPAILLLVAWMAQQGNVAFEPHKTWQQLEIEQ